jgi:pimeloyl-ACP methyl ester carboxylesterase
MPERRSLVAQLRGATKLAVDATRIVTEIVESMHHTIGAGPDILGRPLETVTKLLTAPTYGAIQGVTALVGSGLDLALGALQPLLFQGTQEHLKNDSGTVLAALNGVLGDYLAETHNPLAIEMSLCRDGVPLQLSKEALAQAFPAASGRLLVMVHGSSMNDTHWLREHHDHGQALAAAKHISCVYLRYNSGLHISENGRGFSALLEQLIDAWPTPLNELALVCHSMGGLVARSACLEAETHARLWRSKLSTLVTLGTPHHGAPLERGGNWIDVALERSRYSAPLARLGKLRSAGVTDLRYGNVLDEHWNQSDRFAAEGDVRQSVALPAGVKCFAIAASTSRAGTENPLGDGLVPIESALGRHENSKLNLNFDPEHQLVVYQSSHLDLLSSPQVFEQLCQWI